MVNWYKIAKVSSKQGNFRKIERNINAFLNKHNNYEKINLDNTKSKYPIYLLKRKDLNPKLKNILIASGFHGNESAGIWGLEQFMEFDKNLIDKANISILPCVNVFGLEQNTRKDQNHNDPNRHYDKQTKKYPLQNTILKNMNTLKECAKDGFLSLHESTEAKTFFLYLYSNPNNKNYISLAKNIISEAKNNGFKTYKKEICHAEGKNYDDAQIVLNVQDESFEKHLSDIGIPIAIVTETPLIEKMIDKRVKFNAKIVNLFIGGLI